MERTGGHHVPALDGVRGLAVLAVLLFHGGVSWLPGGFLGVDAFFVLSGYLITGLLLSGQPLASFWERRARRLLPALLLLVPVVLLLGLVTGLNAAPRDALGALTYLSNWRSYATGGGYFAEFAAPSAFKHTWSLAVEAQFYVLWPLLVVYVCRRARAPVFAAAGVGALVSAAAMAASFVPGGDPARAYYGTDTRIQALLVGAALAVVLASRAAARHDPPSLPTSSAGPHTPAQLSTAARPPAPVRLSTPAGPPTPARPGLLTASGVLGIALSLYVWHASNGSDAPLYGGGFLLAAVATAAVIASVVCLPVGPLARALSFRPLRAVGMVSYGVYLWHWPVFLLLTRERTGLSGALLLAARFAVTAACTAVSWYLVEVPARSWRPRLPAVHVRRVAVAASAAFVTGAVLSLVPAGSPVPPLAAAADPASTPAPAPPDTTTAARASPASARGSPAATAAAPRGTTRVVFVGDSVGHTLGQGLADGDGFDFVAAGVLGCGVVTGNFRYFGLERRSPAESCTTWPELWRASITRHRPDVVAVVLGRWEVMDRKRHGEWQHVGQREYDTYLAGQLSRAVDVASESGAKVTLLTAPYYLRERPDGGHFPEDDEARADRFNEVLRDVAARRGVPVVELGAALSPEGRFAKHINGTLVRYDGVHISPAGCRLLRPWLLRQLRELG